MEISAERLKTWDIAHRFQDKGFLSGCEYQETLDFLHLNDILKKGDKVLEIGVGMGYVTKGFKENGFDISGFDIVQIALDNVKEYCTTYNFTQIESLPSDYFDVILCNNVAQHVPTELLKYELRYFIKSLKKSGVMAIKSISANGYEDTGSDVGFTIETTQPIKCSRSIGCFCRSINNFKKLISICGGEAMVISDVPCYVNPTFAFITGTQIYHVTRK